MFFIFGWNKPEIKSYGPVYEHTCPNCHNTTYWQLNKVSYYFTLFFIPIFPHESKYWYYCPVCNKGLEIKKDIAAQYQIVAEANNSFLNKMITDKERIDRIENVNKAINLIETKSHAK